MLRRRIIPIQKSEVAMQSTTGSFAKRAVSALVVALVTVTLVALPRGEARADEHGSTPAPFGSVYIDVQQGDALDPNDNTVYAVEVGRLAVDLSMICHYDATLTITYPGVVETVDAPFHFGCTPGVAWFEFPAATNRTYPPGTIMCGEWSENNGANVYAACVPIDG